MQILSESCKVIFNARGDPSEYDYDKLYSVVKMTVWDLETLTGKLSQILM